MYYPTLRVQFLYNLHLQIDLNDSSKTSKRFSQLCFNFFQYIIVLDNYGSYISKIFCSVKSVVPMLIADGVFGLRAFPVIMCLVYMKPHFLLSFVYRQKRFFRYHYLSSSHNAQTISIITVLLCRISNLMFALRTP